MSINYLLEKLEYRNILRDINNKINDNLKTINSKNREYILTELNKMINTYPDTLFSTEIIELLGKLSDKKDLKSNIALLKIQIAKCESFEKEEKISQLLSLMEENNCSDEEIIKNLEDYKSYYQSIKLLIPYYVKNNEEYMLEQTVLYKNSMMYLML